MITQWELSVSCMVLHVQLFVTTDLLLKTACVLLCYWTDMVFKPLNACMTQFVHSHA